MAAINKLIFIYNNKIKKDNEPSVDIESTNLDCALCIIKDNNSKNKDKLGKVDLYERTYTLEKNKTIKRNIYRLYIYENEIYDFTD